MELSARPVAAPGFGEAVDFGHAKQHCYFSHESNNPARIVPKGPALDLEAPHNRSRLFHQHSGGAAKP